MLNSSQDSLERLSIGKAAKYLGISIDTLRRWETKGRVTPLRSPGGHRYFTKDELDKLFGKRYVRDSIPSESVSKVKVDDNLLTTTEKSINKFPPVESLHPSSRLNSHPDSASLTAKPEFSGSLNKSDPSFAIPTPNTPFSMPPLETKPAPPPIIDQNIQPPQETETKEILIPPIKLLKIQGSSIPTQHAQTTSDKPVQATRKSPVLSSNQKTMLQSIISERGKSKKKIPVMKIVIIGMILFAILDLIIAYILFSSSSMISPIP